MPDQARHSRTLRRHPGTIALVLVVFALALWARAAVLSAPHREGDEVLYRALVEQLREGRGYTLQGHRVLDAGFFSREIYDRPIFPQHPPGGALLFLACDRLAPGRGGSVAQLVGFASFFLGTLALWFAVEASPHPLGLALTALACALSPISVHVGMREWLDGPLLGFTTLGAAVYLLGVRRQRAGLAIAGAVLLAASMWIKLTAAVVFPWLIALSFALVGPEGRRRAGRAALALGGLALASVLPWVVWQSVHGMQFGIARQPSADLLRQNRYIHFVSEVRSPLLYLLATPRVLFTLVPSAALLWIRRGDPLMRWRWLALALWVVGTLIVYTGIGALGYSKLLRYAVLVTPAAIVLFASLVQHVWLSPERNAVGVFWCAVGIAALVLEMLHGAALLSDRRDLIVPLLGWSPPWRLLVGG
jgi:4-amino-4-deoxy-L-arabinose transferase-like glycosyltransferase